METLKYYGYSGTVEFSKEDLFGKVLGVNTNINSYEGKNKKELKADFEAGVDLYLKSCKNRETRL